MTTSVDKELPLKFKKFRMVAPRPDYTVKDQIQTIQALKHNRNEVMKINNKKAREEFIKNKFQRPTQLIAPIDPVDYFKEIKQPSPEQTKLLNTISEIRQKAALSKNNCTEQLKEPKNARPFQVVKGVDLLSGTVRDQGHFVTNNRTQVISYFYESNFRPKFQGEFKDGVDRFPNLFNKQKSEFLKFSNVNESTQRIIKSYMSTNNVRNVTSAGLPAAGKPSSPFPAARR
jgi:hypothetical protein